MHPQAQRFIADLTELGLNPRIEAELIIYDVEPVDGAHAGQLIPTAVAISEVQQWPTVPPHWVHFAAAITFTKTNSRHSSRDGWNMHSRQITGWGRDARPGAGWLSHVRAVLGEATA